MYLNFLQLKSTYYSILPVYYNISKYIIVYYNISQYIIVYYSLSQYITVFYVYYLSTLDIVTVEVKMVDYLMPLALILYQVMLIVSIIICNVIL